MVVGRWGSRPIPADRCASQRMWRMLLLVSFILITITNLLCRWSFSVIAAVLLNPIPNVIPFHQYRMTCIERPFDRRKFGIRIDQSRYSRIIIITQKETQVTRTRLFVKVVVMHDKYRYPTTIDKNQKNWRKEGYCTRNATKQWNHNAERRVEHAFRHSGVSTTVHYTWSSESYSQVGRSVTPLNKNVRPTVMNKNRMQ